MFDFIEDKCSETWKLEIPCPFSGLAKTTPEIYCEKVWYYLIEKSTHIA